ncbi:MAG: CPBP family intramembrane glutamic endopeptidase [Gemmatimonas sp.]
MSNTHSVHASARAIVRVFAFVVAYFLIMYAASVPKGMAPRRVADIVWGGLTSIAVYMLTRFLLLNEQRTRRELGLEFDKRSAARLLGGAAIGFAVYGLSVVTISLTLGPLRLSPASAPDATTWMLIIASFLALSCMEELGFRAYPLRTLIRVLGVWPAQLSVAVLFGLTHLIFGWTWQSVVMGVIPSGLLFGVMAVRSNGLAMPIGLHAALNIAQWILSAKDTPGVWTVSTDPAHTARVTAFAPWVALPVTLLATVIIAKWPLRREVANDSTD